MVGNATVKLTQTSAAKAGNYIVQVIASEGTAADTVEYNLHVKAAPIILQEPSMIQVTDVVLKTANPTSKDSLEFVVTVTNAGGADTVGTTVTSTIGTVPGKFFTTGKMAAKEVLTKTEKIAPLDAGTHKVTYKTTYKTKAGKDTTSMKAIDVVVGVPLVTVVGVPTVITEVAEKAIVTGTVITGSTPVKGMENVASIADLQTKAAQIIKDNPTIDDNAKSVLQTVAAMADAGLQVSADAPVAVKFSDPAVTATVQTLVVTKEIDESKDRQLVPSFAALAMVKLPFVQVKSTVLKANGDKTESLTTDNITVAFTVQESPNFVYIKSGVNGVRISKANGAIALLSTSSPKLWGKLVGSDVLKTIVAGQKVDAIMVAALSGAIAANFGAFGELGAIANTLPVISVAPIAKKWAEKVGTDAVYTTWNDYKATATGDKPVFSNSKAATETKSYTNPATTTTQIHVFTATDADKDVVTYSVETAFTRWTVPGGTVHVQGFVD